MRFVQSKNGRDQPALLKKKKHRKVMIFSSKIIPRTGTFTHVSFPCFKRTTFRVVLISLYRLLLSKAVLTFSSNLKIYEWYPGNQSEFKRFQVNGKCHFNLQSKPVLCECHQFGHYIVELLPMYIHLCIQIFFHVERNLRLEIYEQKS